MDKFLPFVMIVLLTSCSEANSMSAEQICEGHGYKKGTELYGRCVGLNQSYANKVNNGLNPVESSRPRKNESVLSDPAAMLGLGLILDANKPAPAIRQPLNCTSQWRGGREYTTCY